LQTRGLAKSHFCAAIHAVDASDSRPPYPIGRGYLGTLAPVDLDYVMLADHVASRADGKLDIYGAGWDTIFAGAVPALHPRLTLAVRLLLWRNETAHPHRLEVIIQAADGQEVARAESAIEPLSEDQQRAIPAGRQAGLGMVLNFENLIFPEFGNYHIIVQWDGNEARPPLRLIVSPGPQ
jgi:hypothetical protein